ncbi:MULTISPECIES: TRAFAC clade GTPase domain-containing protein [Psychrobacter]|uniref:TRAFAC clade GTPase domain-containing protein n=1 Tax=Psychrobacter TaxID=497 RepID=UPI001918AF5A|nr:hypothetical protein [Psychrobacter fozii]
MSDSEIFVSGVCSREGKDCYVSDGGTCAEGKDHPSECDCFKVESEETTESSELKQYGIWWSGNNLGIQDLSKIQARGESRLIGVFGSHDTGKTTFLLIAYLNYIRRGLELTYKFAGSKSLVAWENLSSYSRLDTTKSTFPPHTSRQSDRVPGLLHLALRDSESNLIDLLLTDAPGEWFTTWSLNSEDPNAGGAQWMATNSDMFIITADCNKLAGENRGKARKELLMLFERLVPFTKNKPTVLIWTKSDELAQNPISDKMKERINDKLLFNIPHAKQYRVTIENSDSVTNVLHELLIDYESFRKPIIISEPIVTNSSFMCYRGSHV